MWPVTSACICTYVRTYNYANAIATTSTIDTITSGTGLETPTVDFTSVRKYGTRNFHGMPLKCTILYEFSVEFRVPYFRTEVKSTVY